MRWFMVDRILECDPGKSLKAVKCFTRSEQFFEDHFHGYPIVPGVLQIEMMAMSGGKAIVTSDRSLMPVVGSVKGAKFYGQIRPGDQCIIDVEVKKLTSSYALIDGIVSVDNKKVASASILYAFLPPEFKDKSHEDVVIKEWEGRMKIGSQNE